MQTLDTKKEQTQAEYRFSDKEIAAFAKQLAIYSQESASLQAKLDSIKADYKGKLAIIDEQQGTIYRKVSDGFEMREVLATITFNDPRPGRKTYRHDNGDVIREEEMTHSDRERELPLEDSTPQLEGNGAGGTTAGAIPSSELPEDGATFTPPPAIDNRLAQALYEASGDVELPLLKPSRAWTSAINRVGDRTTLQIWTAFRSMATKQGWPVACITLMRDATRDSEVIPLIQTLGAHVEQPTKDSTKPQEVGTMQPAGESPATSSDDAGGPDNSAAESEGVQDPTAL